MPSRKPKLNTISDQIAESFAPRSLVEPDNDSEDETRPKMVDISSDDSDYENTTRVLSEFRKRNVNLLSEQSDRYRGAVSSRDAIAEESEEYEPESEDDGALSVVSPSELEAVGIACGDNDTQFDIGDLGSGLGAAGMAFEADVFQQSDSDSNTSENVVDLKNFRKKPKILQVKEKKKDNSWTEEVIGGGDRKRENNASGNIETSENDSTDESVPGDGEIDEAVLLAEANESEEIKKGLAVLNQIKLWEKLLEVRIQSQKILYKAHALPQRDHYADLMTNNKEFAIAARETIDGVQGLLNDMVNMQSCLTVQYPETKDLLKREPAKKRSLGSSASESGAPPLKKYGLNLEETHNSFRPYRDSVLQKWDDRTKILAPGAGTRGNDFTTDVVKKIQEIMLNKNDLIRKSQTAKGTYNIFGQQSAPTGTGTATNNETICNPEIYDDTDFYHQQLRELIEYKTGSTDDPAVIARQHMELQELRKKMKKYVDTRATKGRKIRYGVHNKLVNFMAPNDTATWTDETRNDLYKSLFSE